MSMALQRRCLKQPFVAVVDTILFFLRKMWPFWQILGKISYLVRQLTFLASVAMFAVLTNIKLS
ncbi:hypothetical protein D0962_16205 [Leptolyngbyaceae cyanobacterium CCMR0082]|uniref:Uncharacterized protein n=1 Tax=Adonisia turfae CCMR0082 TaxID=2304604 RepID=A0A6M0S7E8_9CYAN|nr:hypothetical protein [Adonisia turfae CCMR0082]